jgi:hypothetical protein
VWISPSCRLAGKRGKNLYPFLPGPFYNISMTACPVSEALYLPVAKARYVSGPYIFSRKSTTTPSLAHTKTAPWFGWVMCPRFMKGPSFSTSEHILSAIAFSCLLRCSIDCSNGVSKYTLYSGRALFDHPVTHAPPRPVQSVVAFLRHSTVWRDAHPSGSVSGQ